MHADRALLRVPFILERDHEKSFFACPYVKLLLDMAYLVRVWGQLCRLGFLESNILKACWPMVSTDVLQGLGVTVISLATHYANRKSYIILRCFADKMPSFTLHQHMGGMKLPSNAPCCPSAVFYSSMYDAFYGEEALHVQNARRFGNPIIHNRPKGQDSQQRDAGLL